MFDLLLTGAFVPFTFAIILFLGLLLLELAFALIGGSLMAGEMDGPDLDLDAPDLDALGIDFDGIDTGDLDLVTPDDPAAVAVAEPTGLSAWLGFGKMPAILWLAILLLSFGIVGITVQTALTETIGLALPPALAVLPVAAVALWFTKRFGRGFARLLPQVQTEAVSERHLGRRTGIVSQGTASRGRPAEVRVTDRFGNMQYLRAEPLRDDTSIAQGTKVVILRHRIDEGYFIVPLPTD